MNAITSLRTLVINTEDIDEFVLHKYHNILKFIDYKGEHYVNFTDIILYGNEDCIIDIRMIHVTKVLMIKSTRKLSDRDITIVKDLLKADNVQIKEINGNIITKFS